MTSCPPYYAPMSSDEPEESSVSTVVATAVGTGHHTLRIQGYSRLKTMHGGNGTYVESSAFKAAGHTWRICCYLDGERPEDAGFVSLFLKLASTDNAPAADATTGNVPAPDASTDNAPAPAAAAESVVHAEYEFALVHHRGTLIKWPSRSVRGSASAFCSSKMWGFRRFISKEDLEGSRFLKHDCFAVRCKVTVLQELAIKEEDARPLGPGKAFARFLCSSIRG
ncbi:hypothetical protein CFC21_015239 [Triticum aestivum]|uniref:MATH domain-containing protein n=2 Tax=Triticum aestivum TaxID=4565 RepID=A0A3B6AS39_WHEAT|nr:hypothetical protein CFC21_015239 [Triticum aestivum]